MSKPEIKVTEKMYDTLLHPVITEKAMKSSENGQVTFRIPLTATKTEVKAAVEALFGVKVKSVNTVRTSGKTKRFRGEIGKRSDSKKAIVTLAEGQNIDFTTGV
ncbi:MAG TPA: 50S ribosomal protein L23 [Alphaproteobacteria bacterium]|nr:50S ribosomal protein L23 [Alphaproteobacteria bacterium]